MENYNHNCLVFATHKLDEGILDYLAYLKKEAMKRLSPSFLLILVFP